MVDLEKLRQIYKFGKELSLEDAGILMKSAKTQTFKKKKLLFRRVHLKQKCFFCAVALCGLIVSTTREMRLHLE